MDSLATSQTASSHGIREMEKVYLTPHLLYLGPVRLSKFGLFDLFFQLEQCFSLTIIQPEQCFSASFSQVSDQRTGPISCFDFLVHSFAIYLDILSYLDA